MNEKYYSRLLGPLGPLVQKLTEKYRRIWWESEINLPHIKRQYTRHKQMDIASELEHLIQRLQQVDGNSAGSLHSANQKRAKIAKPYLEKISHLSEIRLDRAFVPGFNKSSNEFIRMVEHFDPAMTPANIYQAMRNVWIMNSLQHYMNREMECTVPVFAYSMLYPYTDNILDDPDLSLQEKLNIKLNLKYWLEGRECARETEYQEKLYQLVSMIEMHFPREQFPGVFQSMLSIYNAQIRSLIQQRGRTVPYDLNILGISLEKGGTSVLADGYLIRGDLTPAEADFSFGFGAFLQFADDIQDVHDDYSRGQMTIYSQLAHHYPLDSLANKLLNFIRRVTWMHLSQDNHAKLIDLIINNCDFLVMEAIAKNRQFYSDEYLNQIKTYFPITFETFSELTEKLQQSYQAQKAHRVNVGSVFSHLIKLAFDN